MKAIMYGAGNIGRGFICPLFRKSGYEVVFIDVSEHLIKALNVRRKYPVRIISDSGYEDTIIDQVSIINGEDTNAVVQAIAEADIMATAVGVNVLKYIVPNLAAGIRKRFTVTDRPLNIIICENFLDADKYLAKMIKEQLSEAESARFDECIGLVEASIGRMVPVQTAEMQDGDPLRICAESYRWLPVDKDAFKGGIPAIAGLVPFSPFSFYIRRKLFIHNMGHAVCAYLGLYSGYQYIYKAIDDPDILIIVKNAMLESAQALAREYSTSIELLLPHIDDLLCRFKNSALGDTCRRVGQDPARKLSSDDRLVGAATLCLKHRIIPRHIIAGIAAGLYRYLMEKEQVQSIKNAAAALQSLAGLDAGNSLHLLILDFYEPLVSGTNPRILRNTIEKAKMAEADNVV
jgi:mannitol-1-phosphate 5-dehydrogenase